MDKKTIPTNRLIIILLAISCLAFPLTAQPDAEQWEAYLKESFGYGKWINQSDQPYLLLENRVFRFQPLALKKILTEENLNLPDEFGLILTRQGIPVSTLQIQKEGDIFRPISGEMAKSPIRWSDTGAKYRQFEIFLDPHLRMGLGGSPDPTLFQINLKPAVRLSFWPGMSLTAQLIIPVLNQLDIPSEDFVRPGHLAISQYLHLPGKMFTELTAGYFSDSRYGFQGSLYKYLPGDQFMVFGKVGYTGFAAYPKRIGVDEPEAGWQIGDLNYLDYEVGLWYRWNKYDLTAEVSYQRFQLTNDGVKLHVYRQYNEIDLGFFIIQATQVNRQNYGFSLRVPLWPGKYYQKGNLIIRPGRYFPFQYFGSRYYFTEYTTSFEFIDFSEHLHPAFIKNQLLNPGQ